MKEKKIIELAKRYAPDDPRLNGYEDPRLEQDNMLFGALDVFISRGIEREAREAAMEIIRSRDYKHLEIDDMVPHRPTIEDLVAVLSVRHPDLAVWVRKYGVAGTPAAREVPSEDYGLRITSVSLS